MKNTKYRLNVSVLWISVNSSEARDINIKAFLPVTPPAQKPPKPVLTVLVYATNKW